MEQTPADRKRDAEAFVRYVRHEAMTIAERFHADVAAFESKYGCRVNIELLTPKMSKRIGRRLILHPLIGSKIAEQKGQELIDSKVVDLTDFVFIKSATLL